MHIIEVTGIRLHGHHGCLKEEALIGGEYIVDVVLHTDFSDAAANDNLSQTIDYVLVNRIVAEEMAIRSKLIEHVAKRIMDRFKAELNNLHKARIKVRKIAPPINGNVDEVAVVIEE